MRRDEVLCLLRQVRRMRNQLRQLQQELDRIDEALDGLSPCELEILEKTVLDPVAHGADLICEKYDIEVPTVYYRRNKALKKLGEVL